MCSLAQCILVEGVVDRIGKFPHVVDAARSLPSNREFNISFAFGEFNSTINLTQRPSILFDVKHVSGGRCFFTIGTSAKPSPEPGTATCWISTAVIRYIRNVLIESASNLRAISCLRITWEERMSLFERSVVGLSPSKVQRPNDSQGDGA